MTSNPEAPQQGDGSASKSNEFIDKLRKALSRDGDFPASAKVVSELRQLTSDPKTTANQIAEIILREPSLGPRVLHLVNSSFYRRAKPIMTVSQAVIQIGMKPLAELCAGLVLLQKFIPAARRDSAFATCLQRTVLTSLLTSAIIPEGQTAGGNKADETGYLAGTFAELGTLLMAFYFPQVYEAAVKRSESKGQPISRSIGELTGLSPAQISIEIIEALQLPQLYKEIILGAEGGSGTASPTSLPHDRDLIGRLGKSLYAGRMLSHTVTENGGREAIERLLPILSSQTGLPPDKLFDVVGNLAENFKSHCSSLDMQLPQLPEFLQSFSSGTNPEKAAQTDPAANNEALSSYLDEIRAAIDAREPTASVITSVMETMAFGLRFDRVVLLLLGPGKKSLVGRMGLGKMENFDPRKLERPIPRIPEPFSPDTQAFSTARPVFSGDPLLPNGWPLAALPIGPNSRTIGVIYGDRINGDSDLSSQEQATLALLAELLERSVSENT